MATQDKCVTARQMTMFVGLQTSIGEIEFLAAEKRIYWKTGFSQYEPTVAYRTR